MPGDLTQYYKYMFEARPDAKDPFWVEAATLLAEVIFKDCKNADGSITFSAPKQVFANNEALVAALLSTKPKQKLDLSTVNIQFVTKQGTYQTGVLHAAFLENYNLGIEDRVKLGTFIILTEPKTLYFYNGTVGKDVTVKHAWELCEWEKTVPRFGAAAAYVALLTPNRDLRGVARNWMETPLEGFTVQHEPQAFLRTVFNFSLSDNNRALLKTNLLENKDTRALWQEAWDAAHHDIESLRLLESAVEAKSEPQKVKKLFREWLSRYIKLPKTEGSKRFLNDYTQLLGIAATLEVVLEKCNEISTKMPIPEAIIAQWKNDVTSGELSGAVLEKTQKTLESILKKIVALIAPPKTIKPLSAKTLGTPLELSELFLKNVETNDHSWNECDGKIVEHLAFVEEKTGKPFFYANKLKKTWLLLVPDGVAPKSYFKKTKDALFTEFECHHISYASVGTLRGDDGFMTLLQSLFFDEFAIGEKVAMSRQQRDVTVLYLILHDPDILFCSKDNNQDTVKATDKFSMDVLAQVYERYPEEYWMRAFWYIMTSKKHDTRKMLMPWLERKPQIAESFMKWVSLGKMAGYQDVINALNAQGIIKQEPLVDSAYGNPEGFDYSLACDLLMSSPVTSPERMKLLKWMHRDDEVNNRFRKQFMAWYANALMQPQHNNENKENELLKVLWVFLSYGENGLLNTAGFNVLGSNPALMDRFVAYAVSKNLHKNVNYMNIGNALLAFNPKNEDIIPARKAFRVMRWKSLQLAWQNDASDMERDIYLERMLTTPFQEQEVQAALEAKIPVKDIAEGLVKEYCVNASITLKPFISAAGVLGKKPLEQALYYQEWRPEDMHRKIEAAFALDITLANVLMFCVTVKSQWSSSSSVINLLMPKVESNWDELDVDSKLNFLRCLKKGDLENLKLYQKHMTAGNGKVFLEEFAKNLGSNTDVLMMHPVLMKPLLKLPNAVPSSMKDNETDAWVALLTHADCPREYFLRSYSAWSERVKQAVFSEKNTAFKERFQHQYVRDDIFNGLSKDDKATLLNLCKDRKLLPSIIKSKHVTAILIAGLDANVFSVKDVKNGVGDDKDKKKVIDYCHQKLESNKMNEHDKLRIKEEVKYFYKSVPVPAKFMSEKKAQLLLVPMKDEAGKDIAPMEAVISSKTLADVDKASLMIALLIEDPSRAFYKVNNVETNMFQQAKVHELDEDWFSNVEFACLLKLLASKENDVSDKTRLMLCHPTDKAYGMLREKFVVHYLEGAGPVAKKAGEKFVIDDKDYPWMATFWVMMEDKNYTELGVSFLAELNKYPERLAAFSQWIRDLGFSTRSFSMTSDLNIYSPGSYAIDVPITTRIREAHKSLRLLYWHSVQAAYREDKNESLRSKVIGNSWCLISPQYPDVVNIMAMEISHAKQVGVPVDTIVKALSDAFVADSRLSVKLLVALQEMTELPFREYFLTNLWRENADHARLLAAAVALDITLDEAFMSTQLPLTFSDETEQLLVGLVLPKFDTLALVTQQRLTMCITQECGVKLKLAENKPFVEVCRANIATMYHGVLKHPLLMKAVFKDSLDPEIALIADKKYPGRIAMLMCNREYPLQRVVKLYPLLDEPRKKTLFNKNSAIFKDVIVTLDDNYFMTFQKADQVSLLNMCAKHDMFSELHAQKKRSTSKKLDKIFKAGIDEGIFDAELVIKKFSQNNDMKDIVKYCKAKLEPIEEKYIETVKIAPVPAVINTPSNSNNSTSSSSSAVTKTVNFSNKATMPRHKLVPAVPLVTVSVPSILSLPKVKPLPVVMAGPVQSVETKAAMLKASAKVIRQEEFDRRIRDTFTPKGRDHTLF